MTGTTTTGVRGVFACDISTNFANVNQHITVNIESELSHKLFVSLWQFCEEDWKSFEKSESGKSQQMLKLFGISKRLELVSMLFNFYSLCKGFIDIEAQK